MANLSVQQNDVLGGRFLIGCHPSIAMAILPSFLPSLMHELPEVQIELVHHVSPTVTDDVYASLVDFGIVVDRLPHQDMVIRELCRGEVAFFGRKADRRRRDFSNDVLLCDEELFQTRMLLRELAKRHMAFRRHLMTRRLEVVAALVDAGAGIGILPWPASRLIRAPQLTLLPELPRLPQRICLVYRKDAQTTRAARAVARHIETHARWSV